MYSERRLYHPVSDRFCFYMNKENNRSSFDLEKQLNYCNRLLNGLKRYNVQLFSKVFKFLKSADHVSSLTTHEFELSDIDKMILGDLVIEYMNGAVYSISCEKILFEYTLVEPVVRYGVFVPGTNSDVTKKINFRLDYLKSLGKI